MYLKSALSTLVLVTVILLAVHELPAGEPAGSKFPKGISGLDQGQAEGKSPGANWLLDAKDDTERFRRLQIYAGGTYEQMWQIGYRFQQIHSAIQDANWPLASHHAGKLRDVFNVALMKRPNRTANAEAIFLDNVWGEFERAIKNENTGEIQAEFLKQRSHCMACHISEAMPFLNDSPIFRDTADFRIAEPPAN